MRLYDSITQLILTVLIAIIGALVITSCGTTPKLTDAQREALRELARDRIEERLEERNEPETEATSTPTPETAPEATEGEFPEGVKWLHPDVSAWPVTSDLSVSVGASRITLDYDKANVWPAREEAGATVNANPWVVAEINGKWYAGTWEWMRFGQTVKNRVINGGHVKRSPMDGDWEPERGQRIGIFVSGLIRGRTRNVSERTELFWVEWP